MLSFLKWFFRLDNNNKLIKNIEEYEIKSKRESNKTFE